MVGGRRAAGDQVRAAGHGRRHRGPVRMRQRGFRCAVLSAWPVTGAARGDVAHRSWSGAGSSRSGSGNAGPVSTDPGLATRSHQLRRRDGRPVAAGGRWTPDLASGGVAGPATRSERRWGGRRPGGWGERAARARAPRGQGPHNDQPPLRGTRNGGGPPAWGPAARGEEDAPGGSCNGRAMPAAHQQAIAAPRRRPQPLQDRGRAWGAQPPVRPCRRPPGDWRPGPGAAAPRWPPRGGSGPRRPGWRRTAARPGSAPPGRCPPGAG